MRRIVELLGAGLAGGLVALVAGRMRDQAPAASGERLGDETELSLWG